MLPARLVKPSGLVAGHTVESVGPERYSYLPGVCWLANQTAFDQQALVAGGVVMQHPVAADVVCAQRRFLGSAAARARHGCPV